FSSDLGDKKCAISLGQSHPNPYRHGMSCKVFVFFTLIRKFGDSFCRDLEPTFVATYGDHFAPYTNSPTGKILACTVDVVGDSANLCLIIAERCPADKIADSV